MGAIILRVGVQEAKKIPLRTLAYLTSIANIDPKGKDH